MKRVLAVDDGTCVKESLTMIITEDFIVAGEAKTYSEAMKLYKEINPDILAINLEIPQLDGLELISVMKDLYADLEIIIISDKGGEARIHEALKAGAVAYIIKPSKNHEFNIAVLHHAPHRTSGGERDA